MPRWPLFLAPIGLVAACESFGTNGSAPSPDAGVVDASSPSIDARDAADASPPSTCPAGAECLGFENPGQGAFGTAVESQQGGSEPVIIADGAGNHVLAVSLSGGLVATTSRLNFYPAAAGPRHTHLAFRINLAHAPGIDSGKQITIAEFLCETDAPPAQPTFGGLLANITHDFHIAASTLTAAPFGTGPDVFPLDTWVTVQLDASWEDELAVLQVNGEPIGNASDVKKCPATSKFIVSVGLGSASSQLASAQYL